MFPHGLVRGGVCSTLRQLGRMCSMQLQCLRSSSTQHQWPQLDIPAALAGIAKRENVPYIDLLTLSNRWAAPLGQAKAQAYFVSKDRTHTNEAGARVFADLIIDAIKQQDLPLAQALR